MRSDLIFVNALLLATLPLAASACSPAVESASSYVQHAPPGSVGFTGRVILVVRGKADTYGTPLLVSITTEKWFLGRPQKVMQVHGFMTSRTADVPCGGFFDFHPEVGSEVVVFGQVTEDIVSRRSGIHAPLPRTIFSYSR